MAALAALNPAITFQTSSEWSDRRSCGLGRSDAGTVMQTYFAELQHHRTSGHPEVHRPVTPIDCPGSNVGAASSLVPFGVHLGLTNAVLCTYVSSSTSGMEQHRSLLNSDQAPR